MKRCICVLLVSTMLFGGCMNRNRVANTFVQVEKALAVAPDSAMRLLKDIPAKSLGNQAMRARYALLYIDAAERAQLNENTDSLLRIAWRYYRKHPQEMQNRCRTLYYMAIANCAKATNPELCVCSWKPRKTTTASTIPETGECSIYPSETFTGAS